MRRLLLTLILLAIAAPAAGWLSGGHARVARAAVENPAGDLPELFGDGSETIAHVAIDPDLRRNAATPELRAAEGPEHYIDLELIDGHDLPANRYQYVALLERLGERPEDVGMLPYAIVERAQGLAVALAEHRRWPQNPHVRQKALVLAGHLAHYAADLVQPLHTTIHHDGRARDDGSSPRTGLHFDVDALLRYAEPETPRTPENRCGDSTPSERSLRAIVLAELRSSHALVEKVYRLEPLIDRAADGEETDRIRAFATERFRAAARFVASLYSKAWRMSAEIELPTWLERGESAPPGESERRHSADGSGRGD